MELDLIFVAPEVGALKTVLWMPLNFLTESLLSTDLICAYTHSSIILKAFLQAVAQHRADNLLCNRVYQGVRDCGRGNAKFCCNVLFLPALQIKLDDLHVHMLKRL